MKNCLSWDVEAEAAVPEAGTAVDAAVRAVKALRTEKGLEKFQTSLVFHATWMLQLYLKNSLSQA